MSDANPSLRRTPILVVALILLAIGVTVAVIQVRAAIARGDDPDRSRITIELPGGMIRLGDRDPQPDLLVLETDALHDSDGLLRPGPGWPLGWSEEQAHAWARHLDSSLRAVECARGHVYRSETDCLAMLHLTEEDGTLRPALLVTLEREGMWSGSLVRLDPTPPLTADDARQFFLFGDTVRTRFERWTGEPRSRWVVRFDEPLGNDPEPNEAESAR